MKGALPQIMVAALFLRPSGTRFGVKFSWRFFVMGGLSLPHLLLAAVIILVLFGGKGKISELMGDVAKGIKSFKKGLSDDEPAAKPAEPAKPLEARTIDHQAAPPLEASRDPNKAS
jgi:sec-independent protein translocase protein TatA